MYLNKKHHIEITNLLSRQECNDIINDVTEYDSGKVVNDNADKDGLIDSSYRVVEQSSAMRNFHSWKDLILQRLKAYDYELNIQSIPDFYVLRYKKGSKYDPHVDRGKFYEGRKQTLIIQLSEESDYDGGSLLLGDGGWGTSKQQGTLLLFDSGLTHWVSEMMSGVRYAIVLWLYDKHYGKNKMI